MGSFAGNTFKEYGSSPGGPYLAPPASTAVVETDLPTATAIVQALGAEVPRFQLGVKVTQAELIALYDAYLDTGSLVYGYETADVLLCGIPSAEEVGAGKDVYIATLDVIRLS